MAVARLGSIALDCDDPTTLATFWAALLGGEIALATEEFSAVRTSQGWIAAVRVTDYRVPTWPDPDVPKQMHVDLAVDDLDEAETEAIRLGARPADTQLAPHRYRVLFDPAGHPFCLTTQIPE
jgi:Glyoxalase-like domain